MPCHAPYLTAETREDIGRGPGLVKKRGFIVRKLAQARANCFNLTDLAD